MTLSEASLAADLTAAMKARDRRRVSVLRGVIAAVKNVKVEKRRDELDEAELIQILRREARKREEASEFAAKAGREELVAENAAERDVLLPYLPAMLSGARLEEKVRALIAATEAPDLGTIMRHLKEEFGSNLDGREASQLAKRLLGEASS